jgi:hypothetical protein
MRQRFYLIQSGQNPLKPVDLAQCPSNSDAFYEGAGISGERP